MQIPKFDKRSLLALEPEEKPYRIDDPRTHGLKLKVNPSGSKVWVVVKRPKNKGPVTRTLGGFPDLTIAQARDKAADALSAIAHGINENVAERQERSVSITFGEARINYLAVKNVFEDESGEVYFKKGLEVGFSEGSIKDYQMLIRHYLSDWKDVPLKDIDEKMILDRHTRLSESSPSRANSAMRCFRAIYNRAYYTTKDTERKPLLPENPVKILGQTGQWKDVKRKKTLIRKADLPAWFAALHELLLYFGSNTPEVHHSYIYTMLLTGLRPSHLLRLSGSHSAHKKNEKSRGYYDKRESLFYFYTQKNDVEMEIPVSTQVAECLKNCGDTWLFQMPSGNAIHADTAKAAFAWIEKSSGVKATPSDLRRTFLTVAESLDLSPYAFKTLVGHKVTDGKQDVTGGYISSENDRLRRATQTISDYIIQQAGRGN